jgi:hypothetical protein
MTETTALPPLGEADLMRSTDVATLDQHELKGSTQPNSLRFGPAMGQSAGVGCLRRRLDVTAY